MQIKAQQLSATLRRQSLPALWISGDETLLVQEACDEVRAFARDQGFDEREVMHAGPGFDWYALLQSANSLSLFAAKKLIDLRLPAAKLDQRAKEVLQAFVEDPGEDTLLLITSPKVEKAMTSAKWFKAIESRAGFVQIWPINPQQMPQWIERRLGRHGMSADPEALQLLAERVEGNLLAAAQEVEKLALLGAARHVDGDTVRRAVADNARFNVFALLDAALAGQAARVLKILYHLRAEGGEPLQILNLLCREVRHLARMRERMEQGQNVNGVMQAERVWNTRTGIIGQALRRHSVAELMRLLSDARIVDQSVKGLRVNNPWDELAGLLLRLAGSPPPGATSKRALA